MARYFEAEKVTGTLFSMRCKCDTNDIDDYYNMLSCAFDVLPTADVRENVHAHWDKVEVKSGEWWHTCSKCKATWGSEDGELDFNFCPNCGAQMDERREA